MAQRNRIVNITSSAQILAGAGILEGFYVNSTSSGIIRLWNNTSAVEAGQPLGGLITPAAGYHYLGNLSCTAGLYCGVQSGAIDITFHIRESD
jgi:hypothetical protein